MNKEMEQLVLQKISEMNIEQLGDYILTCLRSLNKKDSQNELVPTDREIYVKLFFHFEYQVKKIKTNSIKTSKLRREMTSLLSVIANEHFKVFGIPNPNRSYKITSERGTLIPISCNCVRCSMSLKQGWRYHTTEEDIYFCSKCKADIFDTGHRNTNMWSNMVFSAFESNRRKH